MSNVRLCMGHLAKTPYHLKKIEKEIFSIEELSYLLRENAFLIDAELFSLSLADWMQKECGLSKIAQQLADMIRRHCAADTMVSLILEYTKDCTVEELSEVLTVVRGNEGLSVYEKRLTGADYLLKQQQYYGALAEYESLLQDVPQADRMLRAHILHNKGVIYAKLFIFKDAAAIFEEAYRLSGREASHQCALAARRMQLTDAEYVDYIAHNTQSYEASMLVEKKMNEAQKAYALSSDKHHLHTLLVYKEEGNMTAYYDGLSNLTKTLRSQYRNAFASDEKMFLGREK